MLPYNLYEVRLKAAAGTFFYLYIKAQGFHPAQKEAAKKARTHPASDPEQKSEIQSMTLLGLFDVLYAATDEE